MKLLMIYADRFSYRTAVKALQDEADRSEEAVVEAAVIGLIHAEEQDQQQPGPVEKKLIKNLKWAARKNGTQRIMLHSFSHLSESKAEPGFTRDLLQRAAVRLEKAGYQVWQTPFGYFLDLDLQAPGSSTARIFTSF